MTSFAASRPSIVRRVLAFNTIKSGEPRRPITLNPTIRIPQSPMIMKDAPAI